MSWGGDRQGGRENKKSSLRHNKRLLHEINNKKDAIPPALPKSLPPPPLSSVEEPRVVDAWVGLFSRQFERDREAVLRRAGAAGVRAIIAFTTDVGKQHDMIKLAAMEAGLVYCCVGVHPDNVKRTNEKQAQDWNDEIRGLACVPECVGMFSGLDHSREASTHFMQERLLETHLRVAAEIDLPVVLHLVEASERLCEMAASEARLPKAAILHSQISAEEYRALSEAFSGGLYVIVTGLICPGVDGEEGGQGAARELLSAVPRDRVLVATNAPFSTPQSIPDEYMRQGRNEPENLTFVVEALAAALSLTQEEARTLAFDNAVAFFSLRLEGGGEVSLRLEGGGEVSEPVAEGAAAGAGVGGGGVGGGGEAVPGVGGGGRKDKKGKGKGRAVDAVEGGGEEGADAARGKGREGKAGTHRDAEGVDDGGGAQGVGGDDVRCRKCGGALFSTKTIATHAAKSGGDADACLESAFTHALAWKNPLEHAQHGRLDCPHCSSKLGDYSFSGLECGCGAFIEAAAHGEAAPVVARFSRKKIEVVREFSSAQEAAEALAGMALSDSDSGGEGRKGNRRGKKKKKQQLTKYDNVSNMGRYRDKDFHKAPKARGEEKQGKGGKEDKRQSGTGSDTDD